MKNYQYDSGFRKVEIFSIFLFFLMSLVLFLRLARFCYFDGASLVFALFSVFVGYLSSDFVSGFVHWAGDTWGTPEWPILGKSLIRPFREHHVDPLAMTKHDFIESSGSHCLISLPVLGGLTFHGLEDVGDVFILGWLLSMVQFVLLTSRIHAWAHQEINPSWIRWLQNNGIILNEKRHQVHHTPPFDRYYCITSGWLNPLLERINFFKFMEKIISTLTGAIPRAYEINERSGD